MIGRPARRTVSRRPSGCECAGDSRHPAPRRINRSGARLPEQLEGYVRDLNGRMLSLDASDHRQIKVRIRNKTPMPERLKAG
jgi:hypothetical protein